MFRNWTLARKLGAGYGLAGLVLLGISGLSYRTTFGLVESDAQLNQIQRLRVRFSSLIIALIDAETGQRGYLLTGDDSYLQPYRTALATISAELARVRAMTAGKPEQRETDALPALIAAKLAELKRTIDLRRTQTFDAALAVVNQNNGKTTMDKIRALIGRADQTATQRSVTTEAEARTAAHQAMAVILWGGLAGVLLVGAIGWLTTRSVTAPVGDAVGQMQSSSAELQAAANQQATGSREQATAMSEITTTISELLATSRQIAESAQRVAGIAEETAVSARTGYGTVDLAQQSIGGIRRQVDQIVAHMLELGRKSQEIGSVLDIVLELAEQTNILAINATIEAAGAGDNGRRFAIVAEEIRKLADRVGGSGKDIRALIDEVRSAVNTTVMATETGSKAVDAGAHQFGEVAAGFRRIAELVATTTDAAREIELSTKQQSTAVEQVNVAMASVAQNSKETEASAGQTLQTASQLAGLSKNLLRIIRPQVAA
ncbi:MAG: methyl-accepting chemotaxis protein [Stellaceae bacterium]